MKMKKKKKKLIFQWKRAATTVLCPFACRTMCAFAAK